MCIKRLEGYVHQKLWLFPGNGISKNGELGLLLCIVSFLVNGHGVTEQKFHFEKNKKRDFSGPACHVTYEES